MSTDAPRLQAPVPGLQAPVPGLQVEPFGPVEPVEPREPGEPVEPAAPRPPGLHVAVIMDGNGRWATARGLPRVAGHRQGVLAVREVVRAALDASARVSVLTLYAFSSDNWHRPVGEVCALMHLFERFLRREARRAVRERVRVSVVGRRDRLEPSLVGAIDAIERRSAAGNRLHVRLAVDYSARDAIWLAACRAVQAPCPSREQFEAAVGSGRGEPMTTPPVDLLIRTGGEQRLSDFLLWECAYAELYFTATMWPDFSPAEFERALDAFDARHRRFGRID